MLLESEIKVGEVYGYDIEHGLGLHLPTKTVKILEDEKGNGGRLTVECQQTGELFSCGEHMLTTIDRCKRMYDGYKNAVVNKDDSSTYSYDRKLKKLEEILLEVEIENMSKKKEV